MHPVPVDAPCLTQISAYFAPSPPRRSFDRVSALLKKLPSASPLKPHQLSATKVVVQEESGNGVEEKVSMVYEYVFCFIVCRASGPTIGRKSMALRQSCLPLVCSCFTASDTGEAPIAGIAGFGLLALAHLVLVVSLTPSLLLVRASPIRH